LELEVGFDARQFELLDNVGDLLKSVLIFVTFGIMVRDHKECRLLKEDNFVSLDSNTKLFEVFLKGFDIWKQVVDNVGPRFVQSLIPNRCLETINLKHRCLLNDSLFLFLE